MPTTRKLEFPNTRGESLAGALNLPDREPRAWVLFAHCFTCDRNSVAAARIARGLAAHGYAVLRFDFTGLGSSSGEFANTSFSSNVEDLVAAADYLRREYQAPALLIGHSLGGTAVLSAAGQIDECRAVVTIGAPATPEHVEKQFGASRAQIEREGEAEVSLAGRKFRIRRAFLEDLKQHPLADQVARLRRALLVFHAPLDEVVSIDEAGRIFMAARHPKSFVSLDGADHLLTRLADAQYVADTIAAWVSRYLSQEEPVRPPVQGGEVLVAEVNQRFTREITTDDHAWLGDEPKSAGGDNLGPDPYEHLLAALGACTSMTLRMYANRKAWPLDDVEVRVTHERRHIEDCQNCESEDGKVEVLSRHIILQGSLSQEQRSRLMEIADRCPVHRTLEADLRIETQLTADRQSRR
ncbi:MAG: OsmC family protein [Pseudomonadales bacterium]|nr:OsmC family protein [Pseudomonadales bacterium]